MFWEFCVQHLSQDVKRRRVEAALRVKGEEGYTKVEASKMQVVKQEDCERKAGSPSAKLACQLDPYIILDDDDESCLKRDPQTVLHTCALQAVSVVDLCAPITLRMRKTIVS